MKNRAFTLVDILVIVSVFAIVASLLLPCTIGGDKSIESVIVSVRKSFVTNGNEMYVGTDKGVFRVRARRGRDEPSSVDLFSRLVVGNSYEVGVSRARKVPQIVSVGESPIIAVEEDSPVK